MTLPDLCFCSCTWSERFFFYLCHPLNLFFGFPSFFNRMVYADCQEMSTSSPQSVSLFRLVTKDKKKIHMTCSCKNVEQGISKPSPPHLRVFSPLLFTEPHHLPSHLTTPLSLNDIPPRIAQTMENEDSWDFDVFTLEAATMKRWGKKPLNGFP